MQCFAVLFVVYYPVSRSLSYPHEGIMAGDMKGLCLQGSGLFKVRLKPCVCVTLKSTVYSIVPVFYLHYLCSLFYLQVLASL